jgi:rfaE bifunctional protein nucleotidyltransferase chain/domain
MQKNWTKVIDDKLVAFNDIAKLAKIWRENGESVVFTNGVFDILHKGHVEYLAQAASLGTKLVVGLNNDLSVKALNKGPERPINDEKARQKVLASLAFVDAVVIFGDPTPINLIISVEPSVLVKGGDYNPDCTNENDKTYIVGSHFVKAKGGKVIAIDLTKGFSTTNIVTKLKNG